MAYPDFLALLIHDEIARREQKKFNTRVRRAGFRSQKTLEQVDFDFAENVNRAHVDEKIAVLIAGPCAPANRISLRRLATAPCERATMCCSQPKASS